jgi:hypothetical protein
MLPHLTGRLPLTEPMNAEQIERIDRASLDILEDVGVVFRDDIALEDWRRAGADVRGERVHLDRSLVKSLISTIPPTITLHARNPDKSVTLGGRQSIFVPMTGAPYLRDLEDVRRAPTLEDLATFPQAVAYAAGDAFLGASYRRADGSSDFTPASADHPFLDPAFGQDLHGHDDLGPQCRGCSGHGRDPVWRGISGNACGGGWQLQRQFAAGVG